GGAVERKSHDSAICGGASGIVDRQLRPCGTCHVLRKFPRDSLRLRPGVFHDNGDSRTDGMATTTDTSAAVVTGASSGIGWELGRQLAEMGYRVGLRARW